jgi:hypothetical protein
MPESKITLIVSRHASHEAEIDGIELIARHLYLALPSTATGALGAPSNTNKSIAIFDGAIVQVLASPITHAIDFNIAVFDMQPLELDGVIMSLALVLDTVSALVSGLVVAHAYGSHAFPAMILIVIPLQIAICVEPNVISTVGLRPEPSSNQAGVVVARQHALFGQCCDGEGGQDQCGDKLHDKIV